MSTEKNRSARVSCMRYGVISALLLVFTIGTVAFAQGSRTFVFTNNNHHGSPNTVSSFAVGDDGTISRVTRNPVATGGVGFASVHGTGTLITGNARGDRLAVLNGTSNDVSIFKVKRKTGRLKLLSVFPLNSVAGGSSTQSIAMTPDGAHVFVESTGADSIHSLLLARDGTVTEVAGSPFRIPEYFISNFKTDSTGRFLAVAMDGATRVALFQIGVGGDLTLSEGGSDSADPNGGAAVGLDFTCSGEKLYVVQWGFMEGPVVNVYTVLPDATLVPIDGSPFRPGPPGNHPEFAVLSADDQFLFLSMGASVASYKIDPDGGITGVSGSPFPLSSTSESSSANNLIIDGSGRYLFGASGLYVGLYVARIRGDGSVLGLPSFYFEEGFSMSSAFVSPPKRCS